MLSLAIVSIFICLLVPWIIYTVIKDVLNGSGIDKGVRFDNYNYHNLDV